MTQYSAVQIPLSKIQDKYPYRYRLAGNDEPLNKSVAECGVLLPLWLVKSGNEYIALDGHRRLQAARQACLKEIPALIYAPAKLAEGFLGALRVNSFHSGLSTIEKMESLQIAESIDQQPEAMMALGMDRLPGLTEMLYKTSRLPGWLKTYFKNINLNYRLLGRALQYSLPEFRPWFKSASVFNLKGAELCRLLEDVQDISLRDKIKPGLLWTKLDIAGLEASARTPQQNAAEIKQRIRHHRYPNLTAINRMMQERARQINRISGGVFQPQWDASLEKPGILLQVELRHLDAVDHFAQKCSDNNILKLTRELVNIMNNPLEEE